VHGEGSSSGDQAPADPRSDRPATDEADQLWIGPAPHVASSPSAQATARVSIFSV